MSETEKKTEPNVGKAALRGLPTTITFTPKPKEPEAEDTKKPDQESEE